MHIDCASSLACTIECSDAVLAPYLVQGWGRYKCILASFVSYLHTVIPSFPLCMLTTCHLSLTFSQQPLETLLFSWFQSIPAWVPMYMWGFVCTRGYLSWKKWSLAAVCSLSISEIAVRFNTVNDLSNVNLLAITTTGVGSLSSEIWFLLHE